ncbi:MAG: dihydrolipoyl dehydrogenase [Deltaproteobacteria bacterium]|nr:dihydrolipoyl dehydrogenase [Deltaproteobacteria bacterium]
MSTENNFDLVVIGGGPGGYVASIRAAQLGMKVACVEKRSSLGGTCLNVGCIPSKALLESSELYHIAREGLGVHGVETGSVRLNLKALLSRKDKIVDELTKGIAGLFKKNKVQHFQGTGRIAGPDKVEVTGAKGEKTMLGATRILIASGSEAIPLPGVPFDGKKVISSTEALSLPKVPKHLIVIGGGVIGLELGSVWLRLGARVTVVEMLPKLLGPMDEKLTAQAMRVFAKQGFEFHLGTRVTAVDSKGAGVSITAQTAEGKEINIKGDTLLVAIGRRPHSEGLGAAEAGVAFDERGRIQVDADFRTSVPSIYAVGDIIAGPMLAHKASEEGVAVVEKMAGQHPHITYDAIPWIVYTWPEIAWVGKGEEELKAEGREYKVGTYPFMANARAKTMAATEGQVKILADKKTDRLLGVLIIGPRASDMIAEAALAVEFGASAQDLALAVHAHPTLSEAIKEAALGVEKRAIHI